MNTILLSLAMALSVSLKVHEYWYTAEWRDLNVDGLQERPVITFNGSFPLPTIEVDKGDSVNLYLTNGLEFVNTSLHFHGILQQGSNSQDGPEMVVQCPIPPGETLLYNFTVNQLGTYWYHSHSGMQYGDGLRGAFIVHDVESESRYLFDHELVWTLTDWYHDPSWVLAENYKSRFNPTGAEPVPQNILFQDTKDVQVNIETDTTYLIHIVNTGMFVSQYLHIEEHQFTVVELDGVYIEPNTTDVLYVAVGQRMSVLVTTKSNTERNFPILQAMDDDMLDFIPSGLKLFSVNWLVYDSSEPLPPVDNIDKQYLISNSFEEFYARPVGEIEAFENSDVTIELNLDLDNLGDGVSYMLFNGKTYMAPKVPTLYTALSSGELLNNVEIYGSNTNSYLVQDGEIVDIVINNYDLGKHPFHLHGHNFQIIYKSPELEEPQPFNYSGIEIPKYPSMRDTVIVELNGNLVIRFKADNPGVWFFHCHVDYHVAMQGLLITLIESPSLLQQNLQLTVDQQRICNASNVPYLGNALGNSDFLNLKGEPLQPKPLPPGFTFKGYVALIISTILGIYGLWTIKEYGLTELSRSEEATVIQHLKQILQAHNWDQDCELNSVDETTGLQQ